MKRVRKSAIVISSDSESDSEHSDYEPESKQPAKRPKVETKNVEEKPEAKQPTKKAKVEVKSAKEKPKTEKTVKKSLSQKKEPSEKPAKSSAKLSEFSNETSVKSNGHVSSDGSSFTWVPADVISTELNLPWGVVNTTCSLLDAGNSLPFLARYRREATGGMGPDILRQVKDSLEVLKTVKEKAGKVVTAVEKLGKMTPFLKKSVLSCQSLAEVEHLYAPYKTGSKASLAERARKLGLETVAEEMLAGRGMRDLLNLVEKGTKGKETLEEVKTGVQHIMVDLMVHDKLTADVIRNLQGDCHLVLESKRAKGKAWDKKETKTKPDKKEVDPSKFENYFDFSCPCRHIKPHQVLAINRGEANKVLSVKVNIPDWFLHQLQAHVQRRWLNCGNFSEIREAMIKSCLEDAYKRLVCPLVQRQTRAALTKTAEEASISVFLSNLRSLLLSPPHRGHTLLSLDPGFSHGCKVAILSPSGSMLDQAVIHPNFRQTHGQEETSAGKKLIELVRKHSVTTIAIGNGTACRETEGLVSALISSGNFSPQSVQYTIVSEQGASIYSCSEVAQEEFPGLDTNIVSAVSIGRRLQDPLSELVKIEPQHLGVGMYQHDVSQAKLKAALEEIVMECVSFVGVDVNSCSQHLLKRVAGMNSARAKAIVETRDKQGDFKNREQLKKIKGIGEKVFTQCAGFIRVVARDGSGGKKGMCELDNTQIHPESYDAATKIVNMAACSLGQLGSKEFISKMDKFSKTQNLEKLCSQLSVGQPTLQMLLEALQQSVGYDYRAEFSAPLFKSGLTKIEDVKIGEVLTGRVTNVTHFGAFVDIGLGTNGLVHCSKMRGNKLELGQRLEVKVLNIEQAKKRIGLEVVRIL
eukprot:GFUD01035199.1.p1 GENE.GFUD01035199.1~~GFUD01035199.1.p1  ORF type:complete len:863 (-),score=296.98 GFUD01035199.1:64-2652(-)